ncbi:protein arginine N-methyltransferase 7-like [Camellia sinensis]|uniref:protein arginine N-methyltransferase 7-like n=1 Tax=Camellia sinensis TaxID=4442 RepID=UPI00103692C0|nr:protein arginine N-methyltransferase 7-like [Camellia sinensis]
MDRVEVLEKRKNKLTMHDTHQKKVELLVGEPFYYGNDSMLPWQNLRFWGSVRYLQSWSLISQNPLVLVLGKPRLNLRSLGYAMVLCSGLIG